MPRPTLLALATTLALVAGGCVTTTTEAASPEVTSEELIERADSYFDGRQYENALETYKMAVVAASGESDEGRFVEASAQVAHVHALRGDPDDGRSWLDHARKRAKPDEPRSWVRYLLVRGVYENLDGDPETAIATLSTCHDIARENGEHVRAVQAAHMATVISTDEAQVRWCRKAIVSAEAVGEPRLTAAVWTQLGWLLEDRGLAEDSLVAFRQARRYTQELDDDRQKLVADWSVGHALRMTGQYAEARPVMLDVLERAQRRHKALRRPNEAEWVGQAQRELAELDLIDGSHTQALTRLEDARRKFLLAGIEELAPQSLALLDRKIASVRALVRSAEGG